MTSQFNPSLVAFGDPQGLGMWELGHFRQHLAYNTYLAGLSPPVNLPVFPILRLVDIGQQDVVYWLNFHEKWHELLRPFANVADIDLSEFDITKAEEWYDWQDLHNSEHQLFDQAFGLG